jgi:hypothetical protein
MGKRQSLKKGGVSKKPSKKITSICSNPNCKLRKGGCTGFEACPGYKGK